MKMRFYHCEICGKVIAVLSNAEIPTVCCGQPMEALAANQTDGAVEKHVPVFNLDGNVVSVQIGSAPHPMTDAHRIDWIGLQTARGFAFRELASGDRPEANFCLCPGDRVEAVYAFCNLHGLWSAEGGTGL